MKIICVGRNYPEHVRELQNKLPEEMVYFLKPDSSLLRSPAVFYLPDFSNDVHYEAELVLRIAKEGKFINKSFSLNYVDGIGIGIDFTARDIQSKAKSEGLPWTKAKGFHGSAPVSDFLPLHDFIKETKAGKSLRPVAFSLKQNDLLRQEGNSGNMIYSFESIISGLSHFLTLKKGDLIFTGTPSGTGKIGKGDILEGYIGSKKMLQLQVE